ncbi:polysaccharide biosynthesis tyrosine autokinase, partial [Jatrophihabitans sp.]|uniref:polysaccharide biosynthesis tyrosine autokinase n=1 Tax=Jatrophihabitans sp. TaxID=1932789 RepID=UPI0030C77892|nr:chromosome partitioning protein [Jatrophihabitans sp.]
METIHYLRALGRSWLVIVLTSIAGASGGYLVYSNSTPEYQSTVRLVVASDTSGGIDEVTAQSIAINRALSLAGIAGTLPAIQDAATAAGLPNVVPAVTASAPQDQPFVVINVDYNNAGVAQRIATAYVTTLPITESRLQVGSNKPIQVAGLGPASYPAKPYEPRIRNDVGLGLAVGIVLGIALILLRELLSQAVQTTEDLQALAGSRVIGTVPRDLPKVSLPVATDPRSRRSEAYRQLRTALLTLSSPQVRSIAVTSALPREGKTSVAANLAVSLSRAGHRVVLIDADLRRPQVAQLFELPPGRGLTDVLVGRSGADDVLVAAAPAGLFLIPAGTPNAAPSELLGSARFDELVAYLVERFDFVIVDTPPVLPVTDALVIGARLDGVVVVTRLGRTTRSELRAARELIEGTSARVLGYVANQARRLNGRQYRYGYESYADDAAEEVVVSPARTLDTHPAPAVADQPTAVEQRIVLPVAEAAPAPRPEQAPPAPRPEQAPPAPVASPSGEADPEFVLPPLPRFAPLPPAPHRNR